MRLLITALLLAGCSRSPVENFNLPGATSHEVHYICDYKLERAKK